MTEDKSKTIELSRRGFKVIGVDFGVGTLPAYRCACGGGMTNSVGSGVGVGVRVGAGAGGGVGVGAGAGNGGGAGLGQLVNIIELASKIQVISRKRLL